MQQTWEGMVKDQGIDLSMIRERATTSAQSPSTPNLIDNSPYSTSSILEYLEDKWQQFSARFGLSSTISHIDQHQISNDPAIASLDYAIHHLSERSAVFSKEKLLKTAMSYGTGRVGYQELATLLETFEKQERVLTHKDLRYHGLLTTKEALQQEKATIDYMQKGKGRVKALYDTPELHNRLVETNLNPGQRAAANVILSSSDRVVGIQGYAGTGKTYMLRSVKELAQDRGIELIGLAPSHSAANTLADDTGITTQTLQRFLFKYNGLIHDRGTLQGKREMIAELKNKVLVLDEASLASTSQMHALLKIADTLKVKTALIGDIKQLGSVEAGKPFAQLQNNGMRISVMDEIVRQKDTILKSAVYDSMAGHIHAALHKIQDQVMETPALAEKAAKTWLALVSSEREKTLITSPSHALRKDTNQFVRETLTKEGVLQGKEYSQTILVARDLTQAQTTDVRNFQNGDVLLFNRNYKRLGIDKGSYAHVTAINQQENTFKLRLQGKELSVDPRRSFMQQKGTVEAYRPEQMTIQQGDVIRSTRANNQYPALTKASHLAIKTIDEQSITIHTPTGEEHTLERNNPILQHIDYGYASTVHAAQGKTFDRVIGIMEANHPHLTTQPLFYVTLSRARDHATIITDNKHDLAETLSKQSGTRIAATEHQGFSISSGPSVPEAQKAVSLFTDLPKSATITNEEKSLGLVE